MAALNTHRKQRRRAGGWLLVGCLAWCGAAWGAPLEAVRKPLARGVGFPDSLLNPPAANQSSQADDDAGPPPWIDDASLADVHFVDEQRGWAVGDRGAVWHTVDGGRHWVWQPSGSDAPLADVHFADAQTGWIVGGQRTRLAPTSTAVYLSTRDGGHAWQSLRNVTLPALRRVGVDAARQNWAVGDGSALHPSGLFTAAARGRNWSTLPGPYREGWLDGVMTSQTDGVLLDVRGRLWTLRDVELRAVDPPAQNGLAATALAIVGRGASWAVGDDGLVMKSDDGGRTWQPPFGPLPAGAERFAWRAVAVQGTSCWIVGTPGSQVLTTSDTGHTWRLHPTGQTLPLRAVTFASPERGWAVGSLGVILHTDDGGASWQAQRGGGRRAAALVCCAKVEEVPHEIVARLAGEDGYRVVVQIATTADQTTNHERRQRVREAALHMGAAEVVFDDLELSPPANRPADAADRPFDHFQTPSLEHVARAIGAWRPEIVIVAQNLPSAPTAASAALLRAVEHVCRGAANDPGLAQRVGAALPPWRPRRLWIATAERLDADVVFRPEQLAPHAGGTLGDVAADARRTIFLQPSPAAARWGLQAALGRATGELSRRDLFAELHLAPGGDARRTKIEYRADAARLRHAALRQRHASAILTHAARRSDDRAAAGLEELLAPLERDDAQRVLLDLVGAAERIGNWPLAAEACQRLADQASQQPAGRWAAAWLLRYWTSDELAWHARAGDGAWLASGTQIVGGNSANPIPTAGDGSTVRNAAPADDLAPLSPAAWGAFLQQRQRRLDNAAQWLRRLERDDPARLAEPDMQFVVAAGARLRGKPDEAAKIMTSLSSTFAGHAWGRAAAAEMAAGQEHRAPDEAGDIAHAFRTAQPPLLDGVLDESCWRAARELKLAGDEDASPGSYGELRLAYDDRFLYLGLTCPRWGGAAYPASDRRRRDIDLSALDRLELTLDTDRDGAMVYRLTVASDGSVADALADDASFDPRWFVATHLDEASWECEAAIGLAELTAEAPSEATTDGRGGWLLSATRRAPGTSAWHWPAGDSSRGRGAGLLTFERTPARR